MIKKTNISFKLQNLPLCPFMQLLMTNIVMEAILVTIWNDLIPNDHTA